MNQLVEQEFARQLAQRGWPAAAIAREVGVPARRVENWVQAGEIPPDHRVAVSDPDDD